MWDDRDESAPFVWGKKLEKQGLKDLSRKELEALNRKKKQDNLEELEKIKKRRLERERQKQQHEEDMQLMQRNKEVTQFEEWQRQEEKFHLEQAKLRSKIRIQDGRAKPIDLLAQYISEQNLEESIEMQMHEPYSYLNGLSVDDLEDLLADIKVYNELEKCKNTDYWGDLTIIVEDEIQKLKKLEKEKQSAAGRRDGIHQSVAKDVTDIFKGKSTSQLVELRKKIESKINSHIDGLDIGYWESLLSQLKAHMARARLRDRHQENLRKKLELLKKEQIKEEAASDSDDDSLSAPGPSGLKGNVEEIKKYESDEASQDSIHSGSSKEKEIVEEVDLLDECFELFKKGNYEPKLLPISDLETGTNFITSEQDEDRIEYLRKKVLGLGQDEKYSQMDMKLRQEARKGMNDDEAEFSVETQLDSQIYLWSDKYRPRKPRYFNRVHTGFEWNKYNQTHYDMDNPPPKIVQGYKFNIFYPDLIDKNATPQYFLTPCSDNPDFATLRFHAGPPYEDIAFKIVNREWEFSYKRGFRCQFHNNIFQLWFHFKRYRYRR